MTKLHDKLDSQAPSDPKRHIIWIVALVGLVGVIFMAVPMLEPPPTVNRLTIINSTDYRVEVSVRGSPDGSEQRFGAMRPDSVSTRDNVVDQGSEWIFDVSHAGASVGETVVARSDLAAREWTFEIPDRVVDRLDAASADLAEDP